MEVAAVNQNEQAGETTREDQGTAQEKETQIELYPDATADGNCQIGETGDESSAEPAGEGQGELAAARQVITQLQQGNRSMYDQLQRSRADFENYKRRLDRERDVQVYGAKCQILRDFLAIVDNFDRALEAIQDPKDSLSIGLTLVYKQVQEFMRLSGLEEIQAYGQPFDPYLHEGLSKEPVPELPEHTILEVLRKGYKLDGKLLRAAQVKVSSAPILNDPGTTSPVTTIEG
jgi:molecular chaperone GrpE